MTCKHHPDQQYCNVCGLGQPRCRRCKDWLFGDIEFDTGLCGRCADYYCEREQRRQEWDYYHPGEPAPKSELEPRR